MNIIFYGLVLISFIFAMVTGTPAEVGKAALDMAKSSVDLAIGLVGYMALFLGLMKVVEEAGGLKFMAKLIKPVLIRLFPDVPHDHPAMGAMVMNFSANALGLGNAATPFGLKAMQHLNELNQEKGTATNAMVLFLAINTSGLALLPTGIIGLRALHGSTDPAAIFTTTLMATACSTVVAVIVAKLLSRLSFFKSHAEQQVTQSQSCQVKELIPFVLFISTLVGIVTLVYSFGQKASEWILPTLILGMLTVGVVRGVKVYEVFVTGAKEGFSIAITIIPYLIAILMAVGMLRASGGLEAAVALLNPLTSLIGLPGETVPLALMRPLSGSGAFGITANLVETYGPDSYIGQIASTMSGSTETTFYVLAVYFGSVGIKRIRHAMFAGLAADLTGVIATVFAVQLLLT